MARGKVGEQRTGPEVHLTKRASAARALRGSRRAVLGENLRCGGCHSQRALVSCMRWLDRYRRTEYDRPVSGAVPWQKSLTEKRNSASLGPAVSASILLKRWPTRLIAVSSWAVLSGK